MSTILNANWFDWLSAVRCSSRAAFSWGLIVVAASALAIAEANQTSVVLTSALLALFPGRLTSDRRIALIAASAVSLMAGPALLLFAVPIALTLTSMPVLAAVTLLTLGSCGLLAHLAQTLPDWAGQTLPVGSATFIWLPSLAAAVVFGRSIGSRAVGIILLGAIVILVLLDAAAGRWLTFEHLGSDAFRAILGLVPVTLGISMVRPSAETGDGLTTLWTFGPAFAGFLITLFLPAIPIKLVVFDEAHGKWETVLGTFGPTEFGRGANYTYILLKSYAQKLVGNSAVLESAEDALPDVHSVFVLKMPTNPLSRKFSDELESWVRRGGRLLVVADHTDLYDTTQNLNSFLTDRFGVEIRPDAVFGPGGLPSEPVTHRAAALLGRIDAFGHIMPWQTGASIAKLPPNSVQLAAFGLSFSEPGDYSRANRFGSLLPRSSLRLANHTAVTAFGAGKGAVAIVLDSTPWSTFSIFKEQYTHLFRAIIHALGNVWALNVWGWGAVLLGSLTLLSAVSRRLPVLAMAGLTFGITLGAATKIGSVSLSTPVEDRDFKLKVVIGETGRLEFLEQLIRPGENNFSRIVSAMSKYDLMPSAGAPGISVGTLALGKNWLFIQPDPRQLPTYESVIDHMERGGALTIMFAPQQAADAQVIAWLEEFRLYLLKRTALAVSEDSRPGEFLSRRGAALLRDTRIVSAVHASSLLKERENDQFFQSYSLRTVGVSQRSGILSIGFSADQFSDSAVGDVWEGIHPATIGRLRESQLAAVLRGENFVAPFSKELVSNLLDATPTELNSYLLLDDGKVRLSGHFAPGSTDETHRDRPSPIEDPVGYLRDLKGRAIAFVQSSCPQTGRLTQCEKRLLGSDVLEWRVAWAAGVDNRIIGVELIHERRFSGVGSTLNVVFGE